MPTQSHEDIFHLFFFVVLVRKNLEGSGAIYIIGINVSVT